MQIIKKTEAPKSLKEAGVRALSNTLKIVGGLIVGFILVHWLTAGQDNIIGTDPGYHQGSTADVMENRAPVKGSPAYVLGKHKDECWNSSQNPKADLPGAAIVQFTSGKTIYTKNHKLVDAAFNEALAAIGFGDKTSDKIDVIALCI